MTAKSLNTGIERMLSDIQREVEYTQMLIGRKTLDSKVMEAMTRIPRDRFVPGDLQAFAFDNGPLPIGHGQTISQPYIVALMTDLLQLKSQHIVLEIGTGSGYQTAILSQLCKMVYTIEVIPELAQGAAKLFKSLGYNNIETRTANGYDGWVEHAPYDGIIVTAAATHIPTALIQQLKPGGRLVIPVGQPYMQQSLMLLEKDLLDKVHTRDILDVAFVPLQEHTTTYDNDVSRRH